MIHFLHVSKVYEGGFRALDALSFFVDKAEFVFLTGASGAGKTTLLKHIYMEESPTTGQVQVCGYDSRSIKNSEKPYLRRKLGIVFQDFRLLNDRNVFENVAFTLRVTGMREREVKRKVFKVLALTGLSHKCSNYPNQLSGGEQQRVAIARAIVNEPWALLADEPTGNLDNVVSKEIFELLQTINSWGTTVIMATHDLALIAPYPYRIIELSRGTLIKGADATVKPRFMDIKAFVQQSDSI
ncbi:MAG: cell division ATP-binding protein FtsE [Chitinispirillia bacterium]|nr:cell division ATP-binding protein FtsE [Chitinispirillia bacterium]MCL2267917.1 cell division ATP-binding protein FtsE [Chitinispirillia bacterium]